MHEQHLLVSFADEPPETEYLRTFSLLPQTLRVFFGGQSRWCSKWSRAQLIATKLGDYEDYRKALSLLPGAHSRIYFLAADADWPCDSAVLPNAVQVADLFTAVAEGGFTQHDFSIDVVPRIGDSENSPTLTNVSQTSLQISYITAGGSGKTVDPALVSDGPKSF